ncbi:MAG: hypothetical protein GWN67_19995 [Phycisphaerae bacterium]|nr:hypothetical protein [Phycisphaerae bacterium]NIP54397.1 hypothetical protein [Phycisphaerae bacterium]NIS53256.1 hypothetical protein [Phycisphaerae bacterium]NIU10782.1 hypothetical protein [Phycisphaerae bacterium]NIU58577.1 hypothetical protein [Phycisphaerae bacterium]
MLSSIFGFEQKNLICQLRKVSVVHIFSKKSAFFSSLWVYFFKNGHPQNRRGRQEKSEFNGYFVVLYEINQRKRKGLQADAHSPSIFSPVLTGYLGPTKLN